MSKYNWNAYAMGAREGGYGYLLHALMTYELVRELWSPEQAYETLKASHAFCGAPDPMPFDDLERYCSIWDGSLPTSAAALAWYLGVKPIRLPGPKEDSVGTPHATKEELVETLVRVLNESTLPPESKLETLECKLKSLYGDNWERQDLPLGVYMAAEDVWLH